MIALWGRVWGVWGVGCVGCGVWGGAGWGVGQAGDDPGAALYSDPNPNPNTNPNEKWKWGV